MLAEIERLGACDVPSVVQKNHTQKLEALEVQVIVRFLQIFHFLLLIC